MAETAKDDRTEQASSRRIEEAWRTGDVPLSKDLSLWGGMLLGTLTIVGIGGHLRDALVALVGTAAATLHDPSMPRLAGGLREVARWTMAVCGASAAGAAVLMAFQTRGRVWPEKLFSGFDNVLSGGSIKKLFSKRMFADVGLSLVKAVTVGFAAWSAVRDDFMTLPALMLARSDAQFGMLFRPLANGAVKVLAAMAIFAGLDFALTRWRHRQGLMMTKQELKRENREDEGDPLIRSRRKRKHRELLKGRATLEVPRADVVLVNPTHIAIALRYRPGKDRAPIVTAKGKGELAEFMRELARGNGIPIVEDIPLARLLYRKVKIGRGVPFETYKAVAAILAFVYRITHRPAAPAPARKPAVASQPGGRP